MREQRDRVELEIELERTLGADREAILREKRNRVVAAQLETLALHVDDRDRIQERVETVGALLEDLARDALLALPDQKALTLGSRLAPAGLSGGLCFATVQDVAARQPRHDADVPGLDRDVVIELDVIRIRIDAVSARSENVTHDALVRIVARDDLAGGEVLAELAHQHAELSGRDVERLEVLPLPRPGIAEVAAFGKDLGLYALELRSRG